MALIKILSRSCIPRISRALPVQSLGRYSSTSGDFGGSKVRFPLSELLTKAANRDVQIREEHLKLNTEFPKESHAPGVTQVDTDEIRRKRLIYRSKQRGWLEVD